MVDVDVIDEEGLSLWRGQLPVLPGTGHHLVFVDRDVVVTDEPPVWRLAQGQRAHVTLTTRAR